MYFWGIPGNELVVVEAVYGGYGAIILETGY
jgi:hypothetical protein